VSWRARNQIEPKTMPNYCRPFNEFCLWGLRLTLDAERAGERKLARLRRRPKGPELDMAAHGHLVSAAVADALISHNRKWRHVWTIGCQLPYISDRHSHSTGPYRYRPNHQALIAACIAYTTTPIVKAVDTLNLPNSPKP
jgi:hypothetical protein